ncbi:MAG: hypothetical protein JWQ06_1490 [Mucilaginibacter sp.]|nr:hypothetical protein [Mucilaginibacter sp.]
MKKLFITAVTAIMFSVSAFAADGGKKNTTGEANVSYTVLNKFTSDYSDAKNAAWTVTPNCQKVTFTLSGAPMTAFYDLNGSFLGTTQDVAYDVVSEDAKKEIASKYNGYAVNEVIKFQSDGSNPDINTLVYFVDLKKADSEVVLRVTPGEGVYYFKTVK